MDELPAEQLALLLPSLSETIHQLQDALHPQRPTRLLHVHTPFQPFLTHILLHSVLRRGGSAAFIDCRVFHSPRLIYDAALNALAGWKPAYDPQLGGALNWDGQTSGYDFNDQGALAGHANDSLAAFIEAIQKLFHMDRTPKFIVFEHAERLLSMAHGATTAGNAIESGVHDGAFLAALSRLAELTGQPITPIFVSQLSHHDFKPPMGRALEPTATQVIHVPSLQEKDYVECLASLFKPDADSSLSATTQKALFKPFVQVLHTTFAQHLSSADTMQELARLATGDLWTKLQGFSLSLKTTDSAKLTSAMKSAFNEEMLKIGHLVSAPHDDHYVPLDQSTADLPNTPQKQATTQKRRRKGISDVLRLSDSAAFLLIAAYLASYNHARTDVRMFAVGAEERLSGSPSKKRKGSSPRKTAAASRVKRADPRMLGPKGFPIERLLAIYDCIRAEDMESDVDSAVHSQVANLLSLRLISRTTSRAGAEAGMDGLSGIKLKVNVTWDVIERVAHRVGFKIADRMWDQDQ